MVTIADRVLVRCIGIILIVYAVSSAFGWTASHVSSSEHAATELSETPHYWAVIPFGLLLTGIAVMPLSARTAHWWESNVNKGYVVVSLALTTLAYLAFIHPQGSIQRAGQIAGHTIFNDYIPFIILLFSLYTISGG